jgi:hypothetical protein
VPKLNEAALFALMDRHQVAGELARIMVAGALAESDGDTDAVGDSGHSSGLFQLHDHGHGQGLSVQQRANPDFATNVMSPIYARALAAARARTPPLAGEELAVFTYMHAEIPAGFHDLGCPAGQRFLTKLRALSSSAAPGPVGPIAIGATVAVVSGDGLRLRAEPSTATNLNIVKLMSFGTLATVLDGPRQDPADARNTFWRLRVGGAGSVLVGWAAGEFLQLRSPPADGGSVGLGATVQITGAGGLRLHEAPLLASPSFQTMSPSDRGTVVAGPEPEPAQGITWWKVLVNDRPGWASGRFLARVAPAEDDPLHPSVLELRQWIALNAATQNTPDARSPAAYDAVIEQFGVERNPRYRPHDGLTFCNIFVSDVTRAMGAAIPHRVDAAGDPEDNGRELTCGGMVEWLHTVGRTRFGWRQVGSGEEARAAANQGRPAVVITPPGVTHDEEHTAIIRPGNVNSAQGPEMAQAGRRCLERIRLSAIFGSRPVEFWVHD